MERKFTLDGLDFDENGNKISIYCLRVVSQFCSDNNYFFDTDEKLVKFLNERKMNEVKYYYYISDDFLQIAKCERIFIKDIKGF